MDITCSLTACGRVYNPQDWFYNPSYVVNRIYYIVSGSAVYRDKMPLRPGYLYIFKASPEFKVYQSPDDPVDHVYFDFLTYRDLISSEYLEIDPSGSPRLQNLLLAIKEDFAHPPHPEDIAKSYLELILYYLKDILLCREKYSEITSEMLRLIHSRPMRELSVNQLAQEMNRNVNHIIRCFKKDLGITPHKYIAMMKVNLAIAYMREGKSRTEIADQLGFESLSAFSHFFHHETKTMQSS